MKFKFIICAIALTAVVGVAMAYEQPTHAFITYHAFNKSNLTTSSQLISNLGLTGPQPFGTENAYIDVFTGTTGTTEFTRQAQGFENRIIIAVGTRENLTIDQSSLVSWLMRGAIREDDNSKEPDTPKDAPSPEDAVNRPLHHFFDPLNNRELQIPGIALIDSDVHKNPSWAIGSVDAFASSVVPEVPRRNNFTVFDAREAMWRALTLKKKDGTDLLAATALAQDKQNLRFSYWATVFRALGDVLHLNQDMAQPQHTRNEAHSGIGPPLVQALVTGHESVYEKYTNARALGSTSYGMDGTVVILPVALTYEDTYPIPTFVRFSDYWSTSPGNGSLTGKGLADYSNHGFFTPAHNFGQGTFPQPASDLSGYTNEFLSCDYDSIAPAPIHFNYLTGTVPDAFQTSAPIKRTASSLWKYSSSGHGTSTTRYSLNKCNFDDMAQLLVPHAVAYSAGLINYFFRGRMEINRPDEGFYGIVDHAQFNDVAIDLNSGFRGFSKLKVKVKNTTDDIIDPVTNAIVKQGMLGGTLVAVVKFHRNGCYDNALTQLPVNADVAKTCRSAFEEIVVSQPLTRGIPFATPAAPNGDTVEFHFDQEIPINAWEVQLQVVYRGPLGQQSDPQSPVVGEDDAVVVATKDISEPTFVTLMNSADYFLDLNGTLYTPSQINGDQSLLVNVRPACRSGVAGSYQLSTSCYNFDENFTYHAGTSSVTIAGHVGPRHFARFALLEDSNQDTSTGWSTFDWQVADVTCPVFEDKPERFKPLVAQSSWIDQPSVHSNFQYSNPLEMRNVNGWQIRTCYSYVGANPTHYTADKFKNLSSTLPEAYALTPSEAKPVLLTITGW